VSDDIVTRLREAGECPTPLRAYLARAVVLQAADEIEDLRFQLRGTQGELEGALSRERTLRDEQDDARIGADNLQEEIERLREQLRLANIDNFNTTSEVETLRAERDEARRMFCDQSFGNKHAVACELGWSCYPEPAHAT